ncbi:helix-turn-helix domain-containing protein [Streptomyces buecherae]|uniref:Helix-turn-helix transcriptional regulator n=1 Tax=Streptomyces buecherae TaxID=2763006 RepID=A0A7H8NFN9_9ACTN|nr:helix-turn-helix transcriptional regulator [Streptomyces buecherae]QKW53196.1 helix-turn-helix transcriptional regulator [Streptomyces buecherae]
MSATIGSDPPFAELDDVSATAYRLAVQLGRFNRHEIAQQLRISTDEATRIERVLSLLCLLHPTPGDVELLVPVSPDAAAVELVGSAENQIRDLQHAVTEVRAQMLSLTPAYYDGRRERNRMEAFDVVSDVATVQSLLDELSERCRSEVLTVQPGGARPAHILTAARKVSLGILDRGVRMRTVYQHTARSDLATRSFVRELIEHGGELRTSEEVIDRMIIYDREVVFLPEHKPVGREPGAAIVREPTLVAFLCSVFEHLWRGATPFHLGSVESDPVTDDLKRSIVRLMAEGYKDEMVARRLGMSVRTCRRHIAEIMEELEATSRFQAGANAALSKLLSYPQDTV